MGRPAPTRRRTFGAFNPTSQAERFDPTDLRPRWVAELRSIARKAVDHALAA